VDLCKKVKLAWPKNDVQTISNKNLSLQISLLRAFPRLIKFIETSNSPKKSSAVRTIDRKKAEGEAGHVHRCSLDSKHYHLMIHGEALARRLMKKKRVFVTNPREKEVANQHLKRLEILQVCLKHRKIVKVSFEEVSPYLEQMNPVGQVDRHFLLTRVTNYH
jgi:hypothetical protein